MTKTPRRGTPVLVAAGLAAALAATGCRSAPETRPSSPRPTRPPPERAVPTEAPPPPTPTPEPTRPAFEQVGIASYYHDSLAGRPTASGEPYRPDAATCAHRTLPFGTVVRVEVLDTGAAVRCRVNDRGPFVKGRVIDVSKTLARRLGLLDRGLARVRVRVVSRP